MRSVKARVSVIPLCADQLSVLASTAAYPLGPAAVARNRRPGVCAVTPGKNGPLWSIEERHSDSDEREQDIERASLKAPTLVVTADEMDRPAKLHIPENEAKQEEKEEEAIDAEEDRLLLEARTRCSIR